MTFRDDYIHENIEELIKMDVNNGTMMLTPSEARQLAAELIRLADEIEGCDNP